MKILALDIGTHTGIAHNLGEGIDAGTLTLATPKEIAAWGKQRITRRSDPRVPRLYKYLCCLPKPDAVVFESVDFSTYTLQVQLWASLRSALWLAFPSDVTTIECIGVSALKKWFTGSGNATKEQMAKTLYQKYPQWRDAKLGEDAVDALAVFYWGQWALGRK